MGSKGGTIYLYNAQSGLPRGSFPPESSAPAVKKSVENVRKKQPGNVLHEKNKLLGLTEGGGDSHRAGSLSVDASKKNTTTATTGGGGVVVTGHTDEVTGIFVDITNSCLVSVGRDGLIIFWNFATRAVVSSMQMSSPQLRLEGFKEGGFVCTVGQDRMMRLFDVSSRKLCRRFDGASGHTRAITDVAYTPDCRRLISASLDCTVRVWDIPTSRCLSWMKFDAPLTSVCLSLSGEYLCVTLADREGIHMYIDRSLYETVHFWKEPAEPTPVGECHVVTDEGSGGDEGGVVISAVQPQVREGGDGASSASVLSESTAQRGEGTITMAALPKAYWITLFNLEAIKERNKPIEAPTAPPQAPFFLPTVVRADTGSLAPAFPTPQEYQTLLGGSGGGGTEGEGKKQDDEAKAIADLAAMGSVWDDGDDDGGWGDEGGDSVDKKRKVDATTVPTGTGTDVTQLTPHKQKQHSRILRRYKEHPRCRLVVFIEQQFPSCIVDDTEDGRGEGEVSPITSYLMRCDYVISLLDLYTIMFYMMWCGVLVWPLLRWMYN